MCECLNDVVEIAVCVQTGALTDDDAALELGAVALWANHHRLIDLAMARTAPVHYAVALMNVPRGGAAAHWLVADLARIIDVEERCGLNPAWRAYAALWLAHMAAAVSRSTPDPSSAERALASARKHVDNVGGVCADSLQAPPTVAELEQDPYAWVRCEGPPATLPSAAELAAGTAAVVPDPAVVDLSPVVLGLRTINSDDWRTWSTAALVRRLHEG
ncbi:hypothetical protein EFK50_11125 [Nocardioides marmoriginsengisoli]|uniref:Uncharacterized protein n=1 Tax=Nocardioides marmoriginsengisoli TaxID=661483 RepID=A0A3N0CFV2_9ACTN|nr:hypothetical protein [Nocardioides marmoriginsengisoli]RNL62325.1 hypothetical protein EFK50_11125 [Nocardioides marmoriginsengisoli]